MTAETRYDTGNRFTYLNAAGTTVIRTTETRLVRVCINDTDTSGVVDIYNGVTVAGEQVAAMSASAGPNTGTVEFDVALSGGLTVVLTADPDVTIVYQ